MFARKANRQYKIEKEEKQKYIDRGYAIGELKDGKLVFEESEKEDLEEVIKERTVLKGQLTKANNRIAELEAESEKGKEEGK